ncbi:unnamed protein product, partial [Brenthis ino]
MQGTHTLPICRYLLARFFPILARQANSVETRDKQDGCRMHRKLGFMYPSPSKFTVINKSRRRSIAARKRESVRATKIDKVLPPSSFFT